MLPATLIAALWIAPAAAAPPPEQTPVEWCAVSVSVNQHARRYVVVSFSSLLPTVISGTVALYVGDRRYDVPFERVQAGGMPGADAPQAQGGKPFVVVRFPNDVTIDAAVVTSVTRPPVGACPVPYNPWLASEHRSTPRTAAIAGGLDRYDIVEAPSAVSDPPSCASPNAPARKLADPPAMWPAGKGRTFHARALVSVTIDQYGGIADARIVNSTSDAEADRVAVAGSLKTPWAPGRFRCQPDVGTYTYIVDFGE